MVDMGELGRLVWRDWLADGVPSSGTHRAANADIRAFVSAVEEQKEHTFPNLEAIRKYDGAATSAVVNARSVAGDRGGGSFRVSVEDLTSLDNNGTIVVDRLGRRWHRIINDCVLGEFFGARGDGNSDDTIALQTALNAAVANKVKLLLLEKSYKTTRSIVVTEHWTRIEGSSPASTIKIHSTVDDVLRVSNRVGGFCFKSFTVDRVGVPTSGAGVYTGHASWGVIEDITATNHWNGLDLGAADYAQARYFTSRFNYNHGVNLRNSASHPDFRAQQWELMYFLSEMNNGWGVHHLSESTNNTMGTFSHPSTYANSLGGIGIFGQRGCSISDLVIVSAICSTNGNDGIRIDPWNGANIRVLGAFCELSGVEGTGRDKRAKGEVVASKRGAGVHIGGHSTQGWVQLTDIMTMLNAQEGFRFEADLTMLVGANLQSKGNCYNMTSERYGFNLASGSTKYIFSNLVSGGFIDGKTAYTQDYGIRATNASNVTLTGGCLENNSVGATLTNNGAFVMVGVQGATGAINARSICLREDKASQILQLVQSNASLQASLGLQHDSSGISEFWFERFADGKIRYRQIGNYPHEFLVNDTVKMAIGSNVTIVNLPTSPSGLPVGALWTDNGTLKVK